MEGGACERECAAVERQRVRNNQPPAGNSTHSRPVADNKTLQRVGPAVCVLRAIGSFVFRWVRTSIGCVISGTLPA